MQDTIISMNPQTECCGLWSLPALNSSLCPALFLPVSTSLVLGLKACDSQILGLKAWATTTWLCFSFIVDQSHVTQSGFELRDSSASASQVLELKMCATTAWPLGLTIVASSTVWSSGKLCYNTPKYHRRTLLVFLILKAVSQV